MSSTYARNTRKEMRCPKKEWRKVRTKEGRLIGVIVAVGIVASVLIVFGIVFSSCQ